MPPLNSSVGNVSKMCLGIFFFLLIIDFIGDMLTR